MSTIDWNKPLRMMCGAVHRDQLVRVSVFAETDDCNKIIKYYHSSGNGPFYTVVDAKTGISFEPSGYNVENVPEEPANCVALIKYNVDCFDESARGKWFVCTVQQDKDANITPMRRSELEGLVSACGSYVIFELPS